MTPPLDSAPNRLERRKAATRTKLVRAAQALIAEGRFSVAVAEITRLADIGLGSFYNHFDSKEELYDAAVAEVIDAQAALLDVLTEGVEDPAVLFVQRFRLTGRLHRLEPELSKVVLSSGWAVATADTGFGPRARRDLQRAVDAGRFTVADLDLAMAMVVGSALALGKLLHDQPERDDAVSTDEVAASLLQALGLSRAKARKLCSLPLPELSRERRPSQLAGDDRRAP